MYVSPLRSSTSLHTLSTLAALLGAALTGCAVDDAAPEGPAQVEAKGDLNSSSQAISAASLQMVNGTYGATCTGRSGGWSLALSGYAGALENPALSVVTNDAACTLSIDSIRAAGVKYNASPTLSLGTAFAPQASQFVALAGDKFYGNGKVNTATFASNFVVNLLLSDDPNTSSGTKTAVYASVAGAAQTDLVAPPNYTFDISSLSVQVDINKAVTSVAGSLALTDGVNTGSAYVVNANTLPASPTFADYDTAFNAGTAVNITGANPTVAGSAVLAAGSVLPSVRTVIVRRSVNGVIAYQAIKITFNAP